MVAGLTLGEELELAHAENRRYRAAIAVALQGLSTARDRGYHDASGVIAGVNDALGGVPAQPAAPPLWPRLAAWVRSLRNRRAARL